MPITLGELEITLKWFKKDKIPGLDGWLIEFYLDFFDIIGNDILQFIEEFRMGGWMYYAFNSTFALIKKIDDPQYFNDFQPISLCNCIYKIIAKIIANRLKPILSEYISPE